MPPSPFQALLGDDFAMLPEPVRRLHSLAADVVTEGNADIKAGFICSGDLRAVDVELRPPASDDPVMPGLRLLLPAGHLATRVMQVFPSARVCLKGAWRASTVVAGQPPAEAAPGS